MQNTMVTTTLDHMAMGGMHDHLGGGFHRYSVDAEWLVPHFEKMLYDNALLALVYLDACPYREVARLLAVPENSISPWLARARDRLKAALPSYGPSAENPLTP